jgi:hypothetical protein
MPSHEVMARVLLTAASLTAAGLSLSTTPARAASTISSCGSTQNVTPSTLAAAAKVGGCKTLVMAAGNYSSIYITSHSGGVLTLRCASKGTCKFQPNGRATGVDGLIIDGIQVTGGSNGLYIRGMNILVQNSTFIEQSSSGVTVMPGSQSDNVQIYNNAFLNTRTGCQYTNTSNCSGRLPDGTPVAHMDYGIRVHNTKTINIRGNRFNRLFNHAISIKYAVVTSVITGNNFEGCGRNCIDLGQETPASSEATISGNTFGAYRTYGAAIRYMKRSVFSGNNFAKNAWPNIRQFINYGQVIGQ